MSDDSAASTRDSGRDWAADHRRRYLQSGGVEGHIEDLTVVGGYPLGTNLLIRYVGRKSGRVFITPLCYAPIGGELAIIASKGGAEHHPDWYLNLIEMSELTVQVATEAFTATWRVAEGAEREKVWALMVDNFPFYARYQASTDRVIPVILLKPGVRRSFGKKTQPEFVRPDPPLRARRRGRRATRGKPEFPWRDNWRRN